MLAVDLKHRRVLAVLECPNVRRQHRLLLLLLLLLLRLREDAYRP
jgi:hypothetical protein